MAEKKQASNTGNVDGKSEAVEQVESTETARRNILRKIVAGGSLGAGAAMVPSSWTRPVVGSVLLPAHAQSSGLPFVGFGIIAGGIVNQTDSFPKEESDELDFRTFVQKVRNAVIQDAQAGPPNGHCISISAEDLNNPESIAKVTVHEPESHVVNGTLQQLLTSGLSVDGHTIKATTLNPDGSGNGTIDGTPFNLQPGSCSPVDGESPRDQ